MHGYNTMFKAPTQYHHCFSFHPRGGKRLNALMAEQMESADEISWIDAISTGFDEDIDDVSVENKLLHDRGRRKTVVSTVAPEAYSNKIL